jgi:glycosyltransferase involved in cell wall biosynthesis
MAKVKKKKVLFIGDGIVPTGFSTVIHNIISKLPKSEFEVHHLAVNYYGDPHDKAWRVYPAVTGGDIWGFNRIKMFADQDFDLIFILNDPWVIDTYLKVIQEQFKKIPPIVVYFPVDAALLDKDWFIRYDIVTKVCVYTQFGFIEVQKIRPDLEPVVIQHGLDRNTFYKIDEDKRTLKAKVYPNKEDFLDSFIVLNANRNQPRKRIDLSMLAFTIFAEDKPENVKLYLHMGTRDMGWDILKMAFRYNIESRLIVTNTLPGVQTVTLDKLNLIYNATDVGLNTAVGEGWSLTNMEHAVTGAPQIIPDHSALHELYSDCGLLVQVDTWAVNPETLTVSGIVRAEDVAKGLQLLYDNKTMYNLLSEKCSQKFTSQEYDWNTIVKEKWIPVFREAYEHNLAQ